MRELCLMRGGQRRTGMAAGGVVVLDRGCALPCYKELIVLPNLDLSSLGAG